MQRMVLSPCTAYNAVPTRLLLAVLAYHTTLSAYALTIAKSCAHLLPPRPTPLLRDVRSYPTVLHASYAMSGTDVRYAATRKFCTACLSDQLGENVLGLQLP
eukprot:3941721-Rhodomonas_salina.1